VLQVLKLLTVMFSSCDTRCFGIQLKVERLFLTDVLGPIAGHESSVRYCRSTLRQIQKERGESMKSRLLLA
jgi:hypothetical protein